MVAFSISPNPLRPRQRRLSAPIQLRPDLESFVDDWNSPEEDAISLEKKKEVFGPVKEPISHAIIRKVKNAMKICSMSKCTKTQCQEDEEETKLKEECLRARRCFSTNALFHSNVVVTIPQCCPERKPKVCFGIKECPEGADKAPCALRPILCHKRRNSVNLGQLQLCPMDYDTFRAWRRGSRLTDEVASMPAYKPYKPLEYLRKSEKTIKEKTTPLQKLVASFMKGCAGPVRPMCAEPGFSV